MPGCRRNPLIHYLKSLGVVRLIAEQLDETARSSWRDGCLVVHTVKSESEIESFFIDEYRPSPIVVPWSGSHFFGLTKVTSPIHRTTPTGTDMLAAFCDPALPQESLDRIQEIRTGIEDISRIMPEAGIHKKSDIESDSATKKRRKSNFITSLRNQLSSRMVGWIDTASMMESDQAHFSAMVGSGGGSDGNANFGDNFLQNLWDVLPDFDPQRAPVRGTPVTVAQTSAELLANSLYATPTSELVKNRTSGLFDAGGVGGPNATQGFEGKSATNPWDFILAMEGAVAFAGAISRKGAVSKNLLSTFPFQVTTTSTGGDSLGDSESVGREFWLPLWDRRATWLEVSQLLSEGRLQVGKRQARSGEEAARAVAELGVSRGVDSFARFGAMKGRIGGDNYFTTVFLEEFEVRGNPTITLLRQVDRWVDSYRRACSGSGPQRFRSALRRYDRAVMDYCRAHEGGAESAVRFREIFFRLGDMQREAASSESFRKDKNGRLVVHPFPSLGGDWVEAVAEDTSAFSLALALGGLSTKRSTGRDNAAGVGSFRMHLEACTADKFPNWTKAGAFQTWSHSDPVKCLAATAERRFLESRRRLPAKEVLLPFDSFRNASLESVTAFLHGETDLDRFTQFVRPLSTVRLDREAQQKKWWCFQPELQLSPGSLVPRSYAVLKLSLAPPHVAEKLGMGDRLRPEPKLFALLRAGHTEEACDLAQRRVRHALAESDERGTLLPRRDRRGASRSIDWHGFPAINAERLAASLLFPLSEWDYSRLKKMVFREDKDSTEQNAEPTTPTEDSTLA
ncbi:MAG: type I-U CRISPR-associated protein Csx17 [Verrucomicrobiales bacterium]